MRLYRQMNDKSKLRISNRLKGRSLTDSHKQAISNSMKAYWKTIPDKPVDKNNESNCIESNEESM